MRGITRYVSRPVLAVVFTSLLILVPFRSSEAQTADGMFLAGTVGFSLQPDDLIGGAAVGGQLGFRFPGSLLLFGEYLYAGTDYYYYDSDNTRWTMATGWSEVPSRSTSRRDWLFYRTRHAVGVAAGLSGAYARIGAFGAAGLMLSFVNLSDAQDHYPEFTAAAEQSSIVDGRVLLTTTLRAGLVYPAEGLVAGQLAYMVQIENNDDAGEAQYIRRNSLIFLGLVIQSGGFQ